MNMNQAMKRVNELLGKRAVIRIEKACCTPEEREEARQRLGGLSASFKAAEAARDARRKALLDGDAEYQRLCAELRAVQLERDATRSVVFFYPVTIGIDAGICLSVRAYGDTLADAIANLESKAAQP